MRLALLKPVRKNWRMPWRPSLWIVREHTLPWVSLAQFKEVHKVVLPSFDREVYNHADIFEGEEVMTLRPEEEDWAVLCQALFQSIKRRGLNRDAREVERSRQKDWSNSPGRGLLVQVKWLGERHRKNLSSQPKLNRNRAFNRRSV